MSVGQLDQNLKRFYAEARQKNGENYSKSSLLGFRHSIERYLNAPPYSKNLRLGHDPIFSRSNQMLDAQLVKLKRSCKENVKHKPVIEIQDLQKLKTSEVFSFASPLSLLRCVWFNIVLYFCRRGREGQRSLTTTSFKFEVDASGRKFATMTHDEASKNHPGGLNDTKSQEKEARMYESEAENDGYKALELYLKKINPKSTAFFQYPKRNGISGDDEVWYEARPIGVNSLDNMMKMISKEAGLSKVYTNHSVRSTGITLWTEAGVENRHIMAISGHRSEQSLAHYNSRPSTSQLHRCSSILSEAMHGNKALALPPPVARPNSLAMNPVVSQVNLPAQAQLPVFNHCTIANVNILNSHLSR